MISKGQQSCFISVIQLTHLEKKTNKKTGVLLKSFAMLQNFSAKAKFVCLALLSESVKPKVLRKPFPSPTVSSIRNNMRFHLTIKYMHKSKICCAILGRKSRLNMAQNWEGALFPLGVHTK